MADIDWEDVSAHASELAEFDEDAQDDILGYANDAFDVDVFGGESHPKLKLARIYLAAHIATATKGGGSAGPVISESAGGLSRSYAVFATSGSMQSTGYGQTLQDLIRTSYARVPVLI